MRVKKLDTKRSVDALTQITSAGAAASLLNGSGDGKSIPEIASERELSGVFSLHSPVHSRSSSAQSSYSTSATTFEDTDEKRGKEDTQGRNEEGQRGRNSGTKEKEEKGNVIVSVRVRPDVGGDRSSARDWLVDGRQSLIAFRGREGGDYYYGKLLPTSFTNSHQISIYP